MNRLAFNKREIKPQKTKQFPNWGIQALYGDRQLIRNEKLTKYFVPYDTAKPDGTWKIFLFKDGTDESQTIPLDTESVLFGRESFCDCIIEHKSVSRQHCVIQFRKVMLEGSTEQAQIIPYIFDMNSHWGTYINDEKIPASCFVQLEAKDTISFGKCPDSAVLMKLNIEVENDVVDD